jgi:histidinol dehydrogenase
MIIKELSHLTNDEKEHILKRGTSVNSDLVKEIVESVKKGGDRAIREYTKRFDGAELDDLRVSEKEFLLAEEVVDSGVVSQMERAHKNILAYHKQQAEHEWWAGDKGRKLGQIVRPVESVGCYVPGGRAFYPSTVLMAAIPAKVAGVERIFVTTPPSADGNINEHTLVACRIAGVTDVYKIGGAQAIAALAYGTESVPKVDMIVGPGNIYVTAAKKAVYGDVGVDMLAGPSEVLIIGDSTARADFIASDIRAQAEHDPNASCVLVSTDTFILEEVKAELDKEPSGALEALKNVSLLFAKDLVSAIDFSNKYAPEHLEIMVEDENTVLRKIKSAGSIFLGPYSPVAAGDYASGPNHILPTSGCARFQSGLNVGHFLKRISVQNLSEDGLRKISGTVTTLAEAEGLKYHSESVKKRLKDG